MRHYATEQEFNSDAHARYAVVLKERTATSYDAFWKVEQIVKTPNSVFWVLWSRPAPLRKH